MGPIKPPPPLALALYVAGIALILAPVFDKHAENLKPKLFDSKVDDLATKVFHLEKKVDRLSKLVLMPRFTRHQDRCQQCCEGAESEEGGPAPLCERGFRLMQEDGREHSQE